MPTQISETLSPIRKGLPEFAILKIIAADKVYADIEHYRARRRSRRRKARCTLLSKLRREELVDYEWKESTGLIPQVLAS